MRRRDEGGGGRWMRRRRRNSRKGHYSQDAFTLNAVTPPRRMSGRTQLKYADKLADIRFTLVQYNKLSTVYVIPSKML